MSLHVVGGVYREYCVHPRWNAIFGSGGRAALAIATLDTPVVLHSYMNDEAVQAMKEQGAWLQSFGCRSNPDVHCARVRGNSMMLSGTATSAR